MNRNALLTRADWVEQQLESLPENKVDFLTDRAGWERERLAFAKALSRLEAEVGRLDPPGRLTFEALSMMGVRATCTDGGVGLLRAWVRRARAAASKAKAA
jgi:hypothetical protein